MSVTYEIGRISFVEATFLAVLISIPFTVMAYFLSNKGMGVFSVLVFYFFITLVLVIVFKYLYCEAFYQCKIEDLEGVEK